jgi:hypothetical protein
LEVCSSLLFVSLYCYCCYYFVESIDDGFIIFICNFSYVITFICYVDIIIVTYHLIQFIFVALV